MNATDDPGSKLEQIEPCSSTVFTVASLQQEFQTTFRHACGDLPSTPFDFSRFSQHLRRSLLRVFSKWSRSLILWGLSPLQALTPQGGRFCSIPKSINVGKKLTTSEEFRPENRIEPHFLSGERRVPVVIIFMKLGQTKAVRERFT